MHELSKKGKIIHEEKHGEKQRREVKDEGCKLKLQKPFACVANIIIFTLELSSIYLQLLHLDPLKVVLLVHEMVGLGWRSADQVSLK